MQRSDSPAREVPGYFLGDPSSGFRMPFDATFTAYMVFGALLLPAFVVLWLVAPLGVFLVLVIRAFVRWTRPYVPLMVWRRRNWSGYVTGTLVTLLALLVVPSPRAWLLPLPWFLAALGAPLLAGVLARRIMPWVGKNTPLRYWINLLQRVASAPRPRRAPLSFTSSAPATDLVDLHEIERLALTIDPREVSMPKARPITKTVEYDVWTPSDLEKASRTFGWIANSGGVPGIGVDDVLHIRFGKVPREITVKMGQYVVLEQDGTFHVMQPEAFVREYERVQA